MHHEYRLIGQNMANIARCPVCGSLAELWEYSETYTDPVQKLVACTRGDDFAPRDGLANSGCLLYMPPNDFYRPRASEAIRYWNKFAETVKALREMNLEAAS